MYPATHLTLLLKQHQKSLNAIMSDPDLLGIDVNLLIREEELSQCF